MHENWSATNQHACLPAESCCSYISKTWLVYPWDYISMVAIWKKKKNWHRSLGKLAWWNVDMPWIIIHSFPYFFWLFVKLIAQNGSTWGVCLNLFWSTYSHGRIDRQNTNYHPMWTITTLVLLSRFRSCQTESNDSPSEFAWWNFMDCLLCIYTCTFRGRFAQLVFSSFLFWIFDFTVLEEVYKRNMQVLIVLPAQCSVCTCHELFPWNKKIIRVQASLQCESRLLQVRSEERGSSLHLPRGI